MAYAIKMKRMRLNRIKKVKSAARQELSFKFRFTRNRQQYAIGSVNFMPTKQAKEFTAEQVREIVDFLDRHSLCHDGIEYQRQQGQAIDFGSFWQGLGYIYGK